MVRPGWGSIVLQGQAARCSSAASHSDRRQYAPVGRVVSPFINTLHSPSPFRGRTGRGSLFFVPILNDLDCLSPSPRSNACGSNIPYPTGISPLQLVYRLCGAPLDLAMADSGSELLQLARLCDHFTRWKRSSSYFNPHEKKSRVEIMLAPTHRITLPRIKTC